MKLTTTYLQQQKKAGLIRDFTDKTLDKKCPKKKSKVKKITPQILELCAYLTANNIPYECEYKFHETRKWRFDIAIYSMRIAIEYEGIYSKKSRHTTKQGYQGDTEKYNAATALGWRVLRYTHKTYTQFYNDIKGLI